MQRRTKCVTGLKAFAFGPGNSVEGPTTGTSDCVGGSMSHVRVKQQETERE